MVWQMSELKPDFWTEDVVSQDDVVWVKVGL